MNKKRVSVTILGTEYTIMSGSPEEEAYIRKTAALVEDEVAKVLEKNGVSQVGALVYAAMNIADLFFKEQSNTENLRFQITQSAERTSKLEKELSRAKSDKPDKGDKTNKREKKENKENKITKPEDHSKEVKDPKEQKVNDAKNLEEILMEELEQLELLKEAKAEKEDATGQTKIEEPEETHKEQSLFD